MIQLYVNTANLKFLHDHIGGGPAHNAEALQWQLMSRELGGERIAFAIDLKTQYWLCFKIASLSDEPSGDEPGCLDDFKEHFLKQVSEHALRVCNLSEEEATRLAHWINIALEPLEIHPLVDREAHPLLKRQGRFVESLIADGYPMPTTSLEWFQLSLPFNRIANAQYSPLEAFQQFWLGLLQFMQHRELASSPPKIPNNVIPFRRPQ